MANENLPGAKKAKKAAVVAANTPEDRCGV
jgi:hypothetical protein